LCFLGFFGSPCTNAAIGYYCPEFCGKLRQLPLQQLFLPRLQLELPLQRLLVFCFIRIFVFFCTGFIRIILFTLTPVCLPVHFFENQVWQKIIGKSFGVFSPNKTKNTNKTSKKNNTNKTSNKKTKNANNTK
jgi:hypothetical protein